MSVRVLLADDHTLVRAGMRGLIGSFGGFDVVGECGDGREAVRLSTELEPDIVVMDLTMPILNGIDATAQIARARLNTRVVVLSMHTAENYVSAAIGAGAVAYVLKDDAVEDLEQALRLAVAGQRFLSPRLEATVDAGKLTQLRSGNAEPGETDPLTQRQREVLQLIAEGHSVRDIGEQLAISPKTVETHRAQIMERLDIHDVAGLTRYAIRKGLVREQ